jgi:hypothetical protein
MMAANGLGGVAREDGEVVRHRMGRIEEEEKALQECEVTRWLRVGQAAEYRGIVIESD